jgi:hypothetical protein
MSIGIASNGQPTARKISARRGLPEANQSFSIAISFNPTHHHSLVAHALFPLHSWLLIHWLI